MLSDEHEKPIVPEDEKLKSLMESIKRSEGEHPGSESGLGKPEVKFTDIFPDIKEDKFESDEDEEERKKNERLERLGQVAAPYKFGTGELTLGKQQASDDAMSPNVGKDEEPLSPNVDYGEIQSKNILIGEQGDILARYRIPVQNNNIDYNLQLPEDSDSSKFSSDEDENQDNGVGDNSSILQRNTTNFDEKLNKEMDKTSGGIYSRKHSNIWEIK